MVEAIYNGFQEEEMLRDDPVMRADLNRNFGQYLGTFDSANCQVRADLFKRGAHVYAYISFGQGFSMDNITDSWVGSLVDTAERLGVEKTDLSIVYH